MSINQNNKYAEKLKSHPVFQDQILRSDAEIKKIFDTTFQFCKELIVKGDILNELENYEDDNDICQDSDSTEKHEACAKKDKKKYEADNEENCCQKANCSNQVDSDSFDDEVDDDEFKDDEGDDNDEFEENTFQYALLFNCMKLYKLMEHILLKKYLYELIIKNSTVDVTDFEKAISFFKSKKIIINEEEEQSIYLLQHLSDAVSNSFIYKPSSEMDYTLLTEDEHMTSNVFPFFLLKTIEKAHAIVERIYGT